MNKIDLLIHEIDDEGFAIIVGLRCYKTFSKKRLNRLIIYLKEYNRIHDKDEYMYRGAVALLFYIYTTILNEISFLNDKEQEELEEFRVYFEDYINKIFGGYKYNHLIGGNEVIVQTQEGKYKTVSTEDAYPLNSRNCKEL